MTDPPTAWDPLNGSADDRPDLFVWLNGKLELTVKGGAVVLGVTEAELRAELVRQEAAGQQFSLPKQWKRQGLELQARYGCASKIELLRLILADQERAKEDQ